MCLLYNMLAPPHNHNQNLRGQVPHQWLASYEKTHMSKIIIIKKNVFCWGQNNKCDYEILISTTRIIPTISTFIMQILLHFASAPADSAVLVHGGAT